MSQGKPEPKARPIRWLHLSDFHFASTEGWDRRRTLEALLEFLGDRKRSGWSPDFVFATGDIANTGQLKEYDQAHLFFSKLGKVLELDLRLQEEAAFDALKRETILAAVGKGLLAKWPHEWKSIQAVVQKLERFSLRHRDEVRRWRLGQLARATGQALRAVVALSFGQRAELLETLDSRRDKAVAAAELLEFWPGSFVGEWAVGSVVGGPDAWTLKSLPVDLAIVRMMAALESAVLSKGLCAAVANHQLGAIVDFGTLANKEATELAGFERPDGARGLPVRVMVQPAGGVLEVLPTLFQNSNRPEVASIFGISRYFARNFARDFAWNLAWNLARDFARDCARDLARNLTRDFARDFARNLAWEFAQNFVPNFSRSFARYFARYFAREFAPNFAREFAQNFTLNFTEQPRSTAIRPDEPAIRPDRKAWEGYLAASNDKTEKAAFEAATLRRAAEVWIALVTTAQRSREEAEAYLAYRLQNVSLLYIWPALDAKLAADPDPGRLALYLQLGWTQSTTTHEWPATERWIALMKADPPAHWWPRAHWHLCWLLHDTAGNPDHQKGFNAALTEGLRDPDPDHLRVAETLKELIGFF